MSAPHFRQLPIPELPGGQYVLRDDRSELRYWRPNKHGK